MELKYKKHYENQCGDGWYELLDQAFEKIFYPNFQRKPLPLGRG